MSPPAVGSEVRFIAFFMGNEFYDIYKVGEESEQRLSMKTTEGSIPMQTLYEYQNISGNTTRMILTNSSSLSGILSW